MMINEPASKPSGRVALAALTVVGALVAVVQMSRSSTPASLITEQRLQLVPQMSCPELRDLVDELGVDEIAPYLSRTQVHRFGQIVAEDVDPRTPEQDKIPLYRKLMRWAVAAYARYHRSLFAYGYFHGYIWYVAGVTNEVLDFDKIRYEYCTYEEFEHVATCMHGLGHAGFIRAQRQLEPYGPCSHVNDIRASTVEAAWGVCAGAQSPLLQRLCAGGYYHAVNEQLDPTKNDVHWMWPCNELVTPFLDVCFGWVFLHLPLTVYPGLPFEGFPARHLAFEKAGNFSACSTQHMATEYNRLACIWGISSVGFGGFWKGQSDLKMYYNRFAPELLKSETPLIDWCTRFIDHMPKGPEEPLSPSDERAWFACISGSTNMAMSHYWRTAHVSPAERAQVCEQLLEIRFLSAEMLVRTMRLCKAVTRFTIETYMRISYYSPPDVDENGVWANHRPGSWEEWINADLREEEYGLWPIHNYTYATLHDTKTRDRLLSMHEGAARDRYIALSTFEEAESM